jgi:type IV pilus assembly protein PilV
MHLNKPILSHQQGVRMIESLIALVIISIGLLGIAALQLNSMQQSASAHWHSQAVWISYEITDRISANSTADNAATFTRYSGIDTSNDYAMDCQSNACNSDQIVTADAADWSALVSTLPNGRGVIQTSQNDPNALVISVMWDDHSGESNCTNGEPASDSQSCYTVTLRL